MQRGLVCYGAMDDGGAVAVVGEGQPVEPGGPPRIEVPLEADLVPSRVVVVTSRHVAHVLLLLSLAWTDLRWLADLRRSDRKLGADVVSWHHHTWGLMWWFTRGRARGQAKGTPAAGPGFRERRSGLPVAGSRQAEFRGPADRRAAVGHGELGADVLGVTS